MPAAATFFCIGKQRPINHKMKATRTRSPGLQKAWPRARYCATISPGISATIKPATPSIDELARRCAGFFVPSGRSDRPVASDPIAPAGPQRRGLSKIVKQAGPRPATYGQTYRARDPRADIDVRFHRPAGPRRAENLPAADPFCPSISPSWPIGSPSWTLPVADRIPPLDVAGGRSIPQLDVAGGRCWTLRWRSIPAGRCRWPIGSPSWTLPVADRIPQLDVAGGRSIPQLDVAGGRSIPQLDVAGGRDPWSIGREKRPGAPGYRVRKP